MLPETPVGDIPNVLSSPKRIKQENELSWTPLISSSSPLPTPQSDFHNFAGLLSPIQNFPIGSPVSNSRSNNEITAIPTSNDWNHYETFRNEDDFSPRRVPYKKRHEEYISAAYDSESDDKATSTSRISMVER